MARTQNRKLTHKEQKFCHNFIKYDGNASEAYRKSYNPKKSSNKTIWKQASRIANKPHVAPVIKKLQEKMQEKLEISIDTQVKKLEGIYIEALADKEYAPAIAAINSQSKHLGLIADKPQTTINVNMIEAEKQLRMVSPEKRAAMLEILEGEYEDEDE